MLYRQTHGPLIHRARPADFRNFLVDVLLRTLRGSGEFVVGHDDVVMSAEVAVYVFEGAAGGLDICAQAC